jgi:hypothetical protein
MIVTKISVLRHEKYIKGLKIMPSLSAKRGLGQVAFRARIKPIKKAIDAGWPLLSIYNKYSDNIPISYGQFTRYVSKYITKVTENPSPTLSSTTQNNQNQSSPQPIIPKIDKPPQFNYNPIPPNKKELV